MKIAKLLKIVGNLFIVLAVMGLVLVFYPVAQKEVEYRVMQFKDTSIGESVIKEKDLIPKKTDFWIVVPKIGASAPVVENVDPGNEEEYLSALKKGVAHALGTKTPGEDGNTFLFAHSTDSFFNVGHYNAVFYLLGKLNVGDEIKVYYKGVEYIYIVQAKNIVNPDDYKYLNNLGGSTLTLQTCYPPGTTLKRLVVVANLVR